MNKLHVVSFIFARGGSKGVPRKNIRLLAGKPLIAYAIETALACSLIDQVIVSTDDKEIAEVARQYGAEVPFLRPKELAQDDSPEWLAWQHAIQTFNDLFPQQPVDLFVTLPPTSPLRHVADITNCIQMGMEKDVDAVITVTPASRNPYYNMVVLNAKHEAHVVIPTTNKVSRRQDAPQVFDMTTVAYVADPHFIMQANSLFDGCIKAVVVPPERALDIDTPLDFAFAEFLLQQPQGRLS